MTANEVAYWNLQEQERANREKEAETRRSNMAKEIETERSNRAREELQSQGLKLENKKYVTGSVRDFLELGTGVFNNSAQVAGRLGSTVLGVVLR